MGTKYLIDTNVLIDFLGGKLSSPANDWMETIIENEEHSISIINKIELLSFIAPKEELDTLRRFVELTYQFPISDEIVEKTIDIRLNHKTKLPDAVIAATAHIHNLTLLTRNVVDFKKINGLLILNVYDI